MQYFYIDMNLAVKGKTTSMDKIALVVSTYVNITEISKGKPIVTDAIDKNVKQNLIYGLLSVAAILLLTLPLHCLLKRRFKLHERIYDLFTAIDTSEIETELKNLITISNAVQQCHQFKDDVKSNSLDI
jgi:hypothetical protein